MSSHQGNYNYSMGGKLLAKHKKLLEGNHKCNSCRRIGKMAYADPYLCDDCAKEIYEGR
jgi:hypothetical protein